MVKTKTAAHQPLAASGQVPCSADPRTPGHDGVIECVWHLFDIAVGYLLGGRCSRSIKEVRFDRTVLRRGIAEVVPAQTIIQRQLFIHLPCVLRIEAGHIAVELKAATPE